MKMRISMLALAMLVSAGVELAHAGSSDAVNAQQNLGKRPYAAKVDAHTDSQQWQGATLQTDVNPDIQQQKQLRKQQLRQQLNMQFMSKRPYNNPNAD
ncbi:MAG TPA: hypothetical protein VGE17_06040 [Methylophilus sp.]